jgi:hypothetical protein
LKLRQRPQIRWCWRRERLLQLTGYPKIPRAETAPGWTPGSAAVRGGRPGGLAALLQRSHAGTRSECVFDAPEGAPHRIAPMASGLISLRLRRVKLGEAASRMRRLPPKRPGFSRIAEAIARPEGWVARKRARCVRKLDLASQVAGAHRSGRGAHRSGRGSTRSADCPVG